MFVFWAWKAFPNSICLFFFIRFAVAVDIVECGQICFDIIFVVRRFFLYYKYICYCWLPSYIWKSITTTYGLARHTPNSSFHSHLHACFLFLFLHVCLSSAFGCCACRTKAIKMSFLCIWPLDITTM